MPRCCSTSGRSCAWRSCAPRMRSRTRSRRAVAPADPGGSCAPGVVAWRSTAALAQLALGEARRARALAEEELELARERGLRRVVIRDLRILAFAAKGTRSLDLLGEAVEVGRAAPPRLEYINALVDLGAATRRANQRTAARHPLRKALELAERGGAAALARRAREELGATGARSRSVMLSGIEALTPSERRVADLAAGGLDHAANRASSVRYS